MTDELKKTEDQEPKNLEGEEPLETPDDSEEPVEGSEEEDLENEEGDDPDSYYKEQYAELQKKHDEVEERLKEKDRQIALKDKALKKKIQPPTATKSDDLSETEQKLLARLERNQVEREAKNRIQSMAGSEAEKELILHHYSSSIVRTGDLGTDIKRALAVANGDRINELLDRETAEDAQNDAQISSMRGEYALSPKRSKMKSAFRKEVEKLVPKEARKHLDKHVPR